MTTETVTPTNATETTTDTKDDSKTIPGLETQTCSRCGGSGSYSWCQAHGSVCFKCGGAGRTYTKRGAAALAFLRNLRSRRTDALVVGDVIRFDSITLGGTPFRAWGRVVSITPYVNTTRSWVNGVEQPQRQDLLEVRVVWGRGQMEQSLGGCEPDRMHLRRVPNPEHADTLASALAYQATLSKTGKPMKRKATKSA